MTKVSTILTAIVLNCIAKYASVKHLLEFNIERGKRTCSPTLIA